MTRLADLTTLRVGGEISQLVEAATESEIIEAVKAADAEGLPLLMLGGGSNLLASDEPFPGVVVRDARRDIGADVRVQDDGFCGGVSVTFAGGVPWDDAVALAVSEGWVGLEALSGIPGSVGASPVQNIGAYGAEVSDTLASVRVWDRREQRIRTLMMIELGFGYRDSILKRSMRPGDEGGSTPIVSAGVERASGSSPSGVPKVWRPSPRYIVLDVTFQMRFGTRSGQLRFGQLTQVLGIEHGGTASTAAVREAVLELRASKGMVLDAADHDTWSAGSFFTNPVVDLAVAEGLPDGAPRFDVATPGRVKLSAAWLIENAGMPKGFAVRADAPASLSHKHTLALTNRGGARAADIVELARTVKANVRDAFGVELEPEPVLWGLDL